MSYDEGTPLNTLPPKCVDNEKGSTNTHISKGYPVHLQPFSLSYDPLKKILIIQWSQNYSFSAEFFFFFFFCYRQTSTLTILVATNLLEVLTLVLLLRANHNFIFLGFFSFCNLIYFLSVKAFVVLFYCTYCVGRIPQETMFFVISRLRKGTQLIHPTTCTKSHRP